jgi:hypothetical protein
MERSILVKAMKIKYLISLPHKFDHIIRHWAYVDNCSEAEVIRRAIVLYDYLHREIVDGENHLLIKDESNNTEKEIVLE